MYDASEDENEEDVTALSQTALSDARSQRKSKSERVEALRKMMDEEGILCVPERSLNPYSNM